MCLGALIWLFSPAWDAVKLTLKAGFICPFVVDDPTDLGLTIMVAQALCLSIFNLSPAQKTCLFTNGNKANLSVWHPSFQALATYLPYQPWSAVSTSIECVCITLYYISL